MSIFDELQSSLQEAVEIKQGKAHASRITRHEVADVKAIRAKLHVSQGKVLILTGLSSRSVLHKHSSNPLARLLSRLGR